MKIILIETVANGWIVRPFQQGEAWAVKDISGIAVFNNMDDLQKALPDLLDNPLRNLRNEHDNSALSQA